MYSLKNSDFIHLLQQNNPCTQNYCGYSEVLPYHSTVTTHIFLLNKLLLVLMELIMIL